VEKSKRNTFLREKEKKTRNSNQELNGFEVSIGGRGGGTNIRGREKLKFRKQIPPNLRHTTAKKTNRGGKAKSLLTSWRECRTYGRK